MVYLSSTLPTYITPTTLTTPTDLTIPDIRFDYSSQQIIQLFIAYGQSGINRYLLIEYVDFAFMIAYTHAAITIINYHSSPSHNKYHKYYIYLTYTLLILDILQNITIMHVAYNFHQLSRISIDRLVYFSSWFNQMKWISVILLIPTLFFIYITSGRTTTSTNTNSSSHTTKLKYK